MNLLLRSLKELLCYQYPYIRKGVGITKITLYSKLHWNLFPRNFRNFSTWLLKHSVFADVLHRTLEASQTRLRTGTDYKSCAKVDEYKRAKEICLHQMLHGSSVVMTSEIYTHKLLPRLTPKRHPIRLLMSYENRKILRRSYGLHLSSFGGF